MIKLIKVNDIEINPIEACDKELYVDSDSVKTIAVNGFEVVRGSYTELENIAKSGKVARVELYYYGGDQVSFDGYVAPSIDCGNLNLLLCGEVVYNPMVRAREYDEPLIMNEADLLREAEHTIKKLQCELREAGEAVTLNRKRADFYEQAVKNLTTFGG